MGRFARCLHPGWILRRRRTRNPNAWARRNRDYRVRTVPRRLDMRWRRGSRQCGNRALRHGNRGGTVLRRTRLQQRRRRGSLQHEDRGDRYGDRHAAMVHGASSPGRQKSTAI